ncbi:E3 ubiquitin-protein ligase TRAIP [Neocloeon triangulifer]|uniref:E3 ubiquitin-protein ligase TRAIP n=1 Tax=Neocloeon triangulifer TaxID=2078957 RepID=UPI00286F4DC7|nr:E3 ubiquitin-protein ligase TRAIP [Neocloeon triangulifer]
MLLSCSICLNLFDQTCDIFCLPCGHMYHVACTMQWFERTQSCPQCRKPTSENKCIKLFPHIADQSSVQDPSQLMQTIDSLNLEIRNLNKSRNEGEAELKKIKENFDNLKTANEVVSAEMVRIRSHNALMKKEIKLLKNVDLELQEMKKLKQKAENDLKIWKSVNKVVDGTFSEADEALRDSASTSDVDSILTMCRSLKRELLSSKNRIQHLKRGIEQEKNHAKESIAKLEKEHKEEVARLQNQMAALEKEIITLQMNARKKPRLADSQMDDLGVGLLEDDSQKSSESGHKNSQKSSASSSRPSSSQSSKSSTSTAPTVPKPRALKPSNSNKVTVPLQKQNNIFGVSRLSSSGSSGLLKRMYDNASKLPEGMTYDGMGRTVKAEVGFKSKQGWRP